MARLPREYHEDDPAVLAPLADLVVADDDEPGITRRRRGRGFSYHLPDGDLVDEEERDRIEVLAVPPAWTGVWIATTPLGHLQATGRDDLDRKQYRYHDDYRSLQEERKFRRLAWFGPALDDLRLHVARALERGAEADDGARAHAVVLRLLDRSLVRVGRTSPSEVTDSRGALSLTGDEILVTDDRVTLDFTAKGGAERHLHLDDEVLAEELATRLGEDPEHPFHYVDDHGHEHVVNPVGLNRRIHDITGSPFTARDFRTWGGTVTAAAALVGDPDVARPDLIAIDAAAERLGNTRAVARSAYVAPVVLEAAEDGRLAHWWERTRTGARLSREERTVMRLLQDAAGVRVH